MPPLIDLTGMTFGKLIVIERSGNSNRGLPSWKCSCKCGNTSIVDGQDLRDGKTNGCGHCKPQSLNDITGERFGRLIVIRRLDDKNGSVIWLCICDCGCEKEVSSGNLVSGRTVSCGCYRKLQPGEANLNSLYKRYKYNSIYSNRSFTLTKDEFRSITSSNCYYCGSNPTRKKNVYGSNGSYTYNGIDRKDNSVGYELNNCVPCCWECNQFKRTLDHDEFIRMCRIISAMHPEV